MIKVKFKETLSFGKGIEHGAADTALGSKIANLSGGYCKRYEITAFKAGYTLAYNNADYISAWRESKRLLFLAVKRKDILPVGWEVYQTFNGNFIESTE